MRFMRLLLVVFVVSVSFLFFQGRGGRPAQAVFHFAVIDEVMTSYNGDANVQFVEIKMQFTGQQFVSSTVLAAFDTNGNYSGDVLVIPKLSTLANSGNGVRWLMATSQFQTVTTLAPDFVMSAGLPTGGGMVCWGAPITGATNPPTWNRNTFTNYVDCVAYGTYSGPTNIHIGTPTSLNADGHSLQRGTDTNNNSVDFTCGDPANPTTNSASFASMAATSSCAVGGIAELPEVSGAPLAQPDSSSVSAGVLAAVVVAATAGMLTLAGAAWYARKRWLL